MDNGVLDLKLDQGEVVWLQDQPHLRYVGSFKRQFKEQEAQSLKERTRCKPGSKRPECVCFVAVEEAGSSEVMGTLDAEPPGPSTAQLRRIPEVGCRCNVKLFQLVSTPLQRRANISVSCAAK